MKLFEELTLRGLIKQTTSPEVEKLLNGPPITLYCGFDPTADSLHIGSLLPLIMLKRLQTSGHRVIVVLGNATASIGDPSGKSSERVMLDQQVIDKNLQSVKSQIGNILSNETLFLENLSWFKNISFIDFLRDVGKNFSVNNMLMKDSVKFRLENQQGISFTEFSYMLLQAEDFRHLFVNHGCVLECGGSDQWSHILSGIDLIKTTTQKQAFGMTFPLITKSDGTKFGKTEKGNIWLSPEKTSPFDFFQFFINVSDEDVLQLLDFLSLKSLDEINQIKLESKNNPQLRIAQKALAKELTILVHGEEVLKQVLVQTEARFSSLQNVIKGTPDLTTDGSILGKPLIEILVDLQLSNSKSMARKDIQGGGIRINNVKVMDINHVFTEDDFKDRIMVVSKGKSIHKIVKIV